MAPRPSASDQKTPKLVFASPEVAYLPQEVDPARIVKTGKGGGLATLAGLGASRLRPTSI